MSDPEQTDGVVTLRERVRERLIELIEEATDEKGYTYREELALSILREFALRPVSQGVVKDQEVEWT